MTAGQAAGGAALLQRQHKLTRRAEFDRVFSSSCRSRDACFVVLAKRNNKDYARLGMVVSARALPLAVGRNRLKRLIREGFRQRQQQLAGLDIVVMAQKNIAKINNEGIQASLSKHWEKTVRCKDSSSA
ncbi:MAG: ribonuclease P protein component [Gammaproteobacteria bacterium]